MTEQGRKILEKAARSIHAADILLREQSLDFATGRAYYAMFYCAQALLGEKGLAFRKHAGLHAAFGEHFAKPGILDPKLHRWLLHAFNARLHADYGVEASLAREQVAEIIDRAREFLREAERVLET